MKRNKPDMSQRLNADTPVAGAGERYQGAARVSRRGGAGEISMTRALRRPPSAAGRDFAA